MAHFSAERAPQYFCTAFVDAIVAAERHPELAAIDWTKLEPQRDSVRLGRAQLDAIRGSVC